jgi:hypothetical protein
MIVVIQKNMHTLLRLALAAALFALCATAASAQSSDNLIVPGQRIGRITIGMPVAEVYAVLGAPTKTFKLESQTQYLYSDVNVIIEDSTQQVGLAGAVSSKYKTREGVGIGSADIEVRAKLGNFSTVKQIPNGAAYCYQSAMFIVTRNGVVEQLAVSPQYKCD